MKRTGELLKKAREQKGLSINEIGLSLKISSKILKAIEDGDLTQLPAKTFLRGFVQSYASYLRLDVNEILKIFQDEMGSTRPSPLIQMPERDETLETSDRTPSSTPQKSNPSSEKPLNSLAKNTSSKTVTLTVVCVLLVAGIIFTKKMIDKYQKESVVSEVEITTPLSPTTDTTATPPTDSAATAMSTPTALLTPTPTNMTPAPSPSLSPSPTLKPTVTPTPKPTATATPTPKPSATPSPTPKATPTPTPSPTASPSPSPAPSPSASPALSKPVEVIVEALDAVEVEIVTKDGKSEKVTLAAEQIHTFKSKNGLRMNVSNGGAVNVIVNGKDMGIPGNLGKPVKLNY